MEDCKFSGLDTKIHKGIATLLLLGIHAFVRSNYELYIYCFTVDGKPLLNWFMYNEKICVSMFVILSGYGLNESINRAKAEKNGYWKMVCAFSVKHWLKLMINFWVVFFSFTLIGLCLEKITFSSVWGSGISGALSFLVDGLGLQDVVTDFWRTSTLNPTWWFMPTIIFCYLLFPLLKRIALKNSWILFAIWLIITVYSPWAGHRQFKSGWIFYLAYFCLGMFFSEKGIFNKVKNWQIQRVWAIGSSIVLVVVTFGLRLTNRFFMDWTHTLAVMWFVEMVIVRGRWNGIRLFLSFLGKHSSNIFMMHTFFIVTYWSSYMYALRYPLLIYAALLVCSIASSIIIEKIKLLTGIKQLQARL